MKKITERQFDFIPQKKWNILSDKDRDKLRDYRRTYRWYKDNDDKIEELKQELKDRKEKNKTYVHKLVVHNHELDHLRNEFEFNWSVSKQTNRPNNYNFYIGRKGKSKSGYLGSSKNITEHLKKYYKRDKSKLEELEDEGWKTFLSFEFDNTDSKVYHNLLDMISQDSTLNSFTLNRNTLFPI